MQTSRGNPLRDVMIATDIDPEELKRIDKIIRQRGLLNHSNLVRDAIRLYLSLSGLEAETRLRILRLINESIGTSGKTVAQLVDEARRENEGFQQRARLSDLRGSQTIRKQDWIKVRRAIRASELVTQKRLEKMYHD